MRYSLKLFLLILILFFIVVFIAYLSLLNSKVTNKLDSALWTVPAKIYSRPLELAEGAHINIEKILNELDLLSYEKKKVVQEPGDFSFNNSTLTIFLRGFENQNFGFFRKIGNPP